MPLKIKRDLIVAYAILFNLILGLGLATSFLSIYLDEKGISLVNIGIIYAIGSCVGAGIRFLSGSYVDCHGRKKLMMLGALGYPLFTFGLLFATRSGHFILLNALVEFLGAMFWTAYTAHLFDILDKHKEGIEIGWRNIVVYTSAAAAPLVAGLLIKYLGYPALFSIGGLICIIGVLLVFLVREGELSKCRPIEHEYSEIWNIKGFKTILILATLNNFIWAFWAIYMPILLKSEGVSDPRIGLILSSVMIVGAIMQGPLGRLTDKYSIRWLVIPGFFFIFLFGWSFLAIRNYFSQLASRTLMGVAVDASWWPEIACLARITQKREHGGASALMMSVATLAYALASWLGGIFTETYGIRLVLWASSVLALIVGLICLFVKFTDKPERTLYKRHHLVQVHGHRHK
jgi:MFS family permease